MAVPGDGDLLMPPEGLGDGERCRLDKVDGEGLRFPAGEVKRLLFSDFYIKYDT